MSGVKVATALTVYGIETLQRTVTMRSCITVATALTVYGIETTFGVTAVNLQLFQLQQLLPFTVLKLNISLLNTNFQQLSCNSSYRLRY